MSLNDLTPFQRELLENIRGTLHGSDLQWIAMCMGTSPQAVGRATKKLSASGLVYKHERRVYPSSN